MFKPHHEDQAPGVGPSTAPQARQAEMLQTAATRHAKRLGETAEAQQKRLEESLSRLRDAVSAAPDAASLMSAWSDYVRDAMERAILATDALRQRGDVFLEHEAQGNPPVLIYDYEIAVDGRTLPRPTNYMLLRIAPPEGVQVHDWKRPYVIIDPRAGHGPGIGGFKADSQVGVALKDGHPVYFVAFRPNPAPGQTLADVTHSEAAFLREIQRRHPKSPKPIVVGNCQGGWATAILAATNPDLAGPIVLNGAPMSYWSGRLGQDPMRYIGGNVGGVLPILLMSDMNGGQFDGANLVLNFETLNPARTWFRKYYDLFANIDGGVDRFLEFERWWGGFFLMNEAEMRWIVENLFVGNRLGKNEARLETGRPIDLKQIRAPIIVFASHGDNITPPQQALNWIVDTYADETEIEILGQRILYMVHEEVGHLGIFVSSAVAKREHTQMASTLKTIEALPPGLYEMMIDEIVGEGHEKRFTVRFEKRKVADLLAYDDGRDEEVAFAAVARMSEQLAETYDTLVRPALRQVAQPDVVAMARALHPMRAQRALFATRTPGMTAVAQAADGIRATRTPVPADNPFLLMERLMADTIEMQLQFSTDMRAMMSELGFLAVYASPLGQWFGQKNLARRARKSPDELRALPIVATAIAHIDHGGFAEGLVRMLILLADTRGNVRRDRLERSSEVLTTHTPFAEMAPAARANMIHMQDLAARFEPAAALDALPKLLKSEEDRREAFELLTYILGDESEMEPRTKALLATMRDLLPIDPKDGPRGVVPRAAE